MAKAEEITTMVEQLPQEEQEAARLLLEKLYADVPEDQSILPAPQQSKKTPKNTLTQYYLVVESTCKLCNGLTVSYFHMKDNGCGGLGSTTLTELPEVPETLDVRIERRQTLVCGQCRGNLFMWKHEKLIDELIKARSLK